MIAMKLKIERDEKETLRNGGKRNKIVIIIIMKVCNSI